MNQPVHLLLKSKVISHVTLLIAVVVLAALVLVNQPNYPQTWYDEGWHTLAARVLAEDGIYAYGPSLGPMVIVPVAGAFKLWGVGLVQARWAIAGYFALAVCLYWVLARRYAGHWAAPVALALWLALPSLDVIVFGRNVMGEVPGTAWLLTGCLIWIGRASDHFGLRHAILAGICWALAVLSKNQFLLVYVALAGVALIDKLYYRARPMRAYVTAVIVGLVIVCGWYVLQMWFPYGQQLVAHNTQQWTSAVSRGLFRFSSELMVANVKLLFSSVSFYGIFVVGLSAATSQSIQRTRRGYQSAMLMAITLVWLAWFTCATIGWDRYLFPALSLASLLVADGLVRGIRWARSTFSGRGRVMRGVAVAIFVLIGLLGLLTVRWFARQVYPILFSTAKNPQQFATRLTTIVEPDALIETWDPEIAFLSGRRFHFPPAEVFDAIVRARWYGDKFDLRDYNWLASNPGYLVVGPFGQWSGIYEAATVSACGDLCFESGGYSLYRIDVRRPGCLSATVYQPNPVGSNRPVTIGHQYSVLAFLPEKEQPDDPPWVVPLSVRRVQSGETVMISDLLSRRQNFQ